MARFTFPWLIRSLASVIAGMALLGPGRALAADKSQLRDDAHLFDAATVERVSAIVHEIHSEFGKDLTIETFPAIPENMQPSFSAQTKEQFYENWLRREAIAADTNGVFILIVKDPGHLQIGVGTRTSKKAFTNEDRDAMRDLMLKPLHEGHSDEAIIQGATFVLRRMEENLPGVWRTAGGAGVSEEHRPAAVPAPPVPATEPAKAAEPAPTATTQPVPTATEPTITPEVKPPAPSDKDLNK